MSGPGRAPRVLANAAFTRPPRLGGRRGVKSKRGGIEAEAGRGIGRVELPLWVDPVPIVPASRLGGPERFRTSTGGVPQVHCVARWRASYSPPRPVEIAVKYHGRPDEES